MFSVLIKFKNTGVEYMKSASAVSFFPPGSKDDENNPIADPGLVLEDTAGNTTNYGESTPGEAFVMNEQGRTVARYHW